MKGTLLLTGFPPDSRTGGAVIVRSLARQFPAGTLDWMTFSAPSSALAEPFKDQFAGALPAPPAWGNTRLRLARFWWWWKEFHTDPRDVRRLSRIIREKQYETVWMVLDSPRAKIAAMLVKSCPAVRFHFSVHDHPVHAAASINLPRALIERVGTHLAFLGRSGPSVDAVTEEMLSELKWDTPYQCVVTAAVEAEIAQPRIRAPSPQGELRVTCIGNYIGLSAMENAIAGLKLWSRATGRPWRLDVYGRADDALQQSNVFAHSYQDLNAARDEILKTDLFLLPLEFDASQAAQMRSSLPTKLVTYAEFGRLIVTCAPAGSATQRIIRDHGLGPVVTNLDPRSVAQAIDETLSWDLEAANKGRDELLSGRFSGPAIFERFTRAVNRIPA